MIVFVDGTRMKAVFHRGVIHGLVRKFWCRFGECDYFKDQKYRTPTYLQEVNIPDKLIINSILPNMAKDK